MEELILKDFDAKEEYFSEIVINELNENNTIYITVGFEGESATVELDKSQINKIIEFLQKQLQDEPST